MESLALFLSELPVFRYFLFVVFLNFYAHSSLAYETASIIRSPRLRVRVYWLQIVPPICLILSTIFFGYVVFNSVFSGLVVNFKQEIERLRGVL